LFYLVFGPINANAKMKMNPKPELDGSDFTIPKYSISIIMESLNLSKQMYFFQLISSNYLSIVLHLK
jgi:vacuolar protein sorting-associated protein 13A/C